VAAELRRGVVRHRQPAQRLDKNLPSRTRLGIAPILVLGLTTAEAVAAPAHNMCVPRAIGVPTREGPPRWIPWTSTSGAVDTKLDDPRWLGSTDHSFELGSGSLQCPLCSPDKFSNLTTSAPVAAPCDGGITIDANNVGAVFNPAGGTDFSMVSPTNQFKAVTTTGVAAPNVVIAQPKNTTGTAITAPLTDSGRSSAHWRSCPTRI
jgi:hypothetical protein